MAPKRKLYSDDAAAAAGVSTGTWYGYRSRKVAPPPDGNDIEGAHVRPYWWEATIQTWKANRPGAGARTDLADGKPPAKTKPRKAR